MSSPSPEYIAAFFDGEGHVSLRVNGQAKLPYLTIGITQKDPTILLEIQEVVGGGIKKTRAPLGSCYQLRIHGAEAQRSFIRMIYPYSRVKRNKLRLAYAHLHTVGPRGSSVSTPDRLKRWDIYRRFKEA